MSRINLLDKQEYSVKYPQKEKAYAFIPHDGVPFESAVVGMTYPSAEYEINRAEGNRICLFEYVLSGEGEVYIDGAWRQVRAGDFYILPSGQPQAYRSSGDDPWQKMWVNYVADYMPALLSAYGVGAGIYRSERAAVYFERIFELTDSPQADGGEAFVIADSLYKIIRIAADKSREDTDDELGMRREVSTYLYRRFSLDGLAETFSMSKSNCIRLYKKRYGVTPYEDLIRMKMEAAKTLLAETALPIKEIADKLCIYDEHYFSSLFMARVGVRPGAYRGENQGGRR